MIKLTSSKIDEIKSLRRTGHSFQEIRKITKCGYGTVSRYASSVKVEEIYKDSLREKQGGSKVRAARRWEQAEKHVSPLIGEISQRDKLLILAALYWGEGTKSELNIINGDSELLRVFLECVHELGVIRNDLVFSLRVFGNNSIDEAKEFWSLALKVPRNAFRSIELVPGNKEGKLPNGMCRIRMRKSERHFKLVMSMIHLISSRV